MTDIDKLAAAVVAMQAELSPVDKSADNPFFKSSYAPLPEVRAKMQPLLAAHGLALVTMPTIIDGSNGLHFYLIHESGQYLDGQWLLTPSKRDPQGEGADVTYKRRFGEMAITGLVADEDDDGNTASARPATKVATKPGKAPVVDQALARFTDQLTKKGIDVEKAKSQFAEHHGFSIDDAEDAAIYEFLNQVIREAKGDSR